MAVVEISCSSRLVLEGKTGKEIPKWSRLESLEKFLANDFTLSDAEDNTSVLLNSGGIDELPLLRTLLAIWQMSQEWNFWEVMDSSVLVAYACLAVSRTLLQRLLACLNFNSYTEDYSVGTKYFSTFRYFSDNPTNLFFLLFFCFLFFLCVTVFWLA